MPGQGSKGRTNKIMLGTGVSFKQMWPFITNNYLVLWNHFSPEFLILPILYILLIASIWWIKQSIFARNLKNMQYLKFLIISLYFPKQLFVSFCVPGFRHLEEDSSLGRSFVMHKKTIEKNSVRFTFNVLAANSV